MDLFDFTPDKVAIYCFFFCSGALVCSLIGICLSPATGKGIVVLVSLFISTFSLLLMGPSSLLHIPPIKPVVGVGLFLVGTQNAIDN